MGGQKREGKAVVDDSVPFGFLLGEQYSGYFKALNTSRDLKVRCTLLLYNVRLDIRLSSE